MFRSLLIRSEVRLPPSENLASSPFSEYSKRSRLGRLLPARTLRLHVDAYAHHPVACSSQRHAVDWLWQSNGYPLPANRLYVRRARLIDDAM